MKRVLARQVGRELTKEEQKMVGGATDLLQITTWIETDVETQSFSGDQPTDCDMSQDYHSFD